MSCSPHITVTVTVYPTICSNGVAHFCINYLCQDNYYNGGVFSNFYLDGVLYANGIPNCLLQPSFTACREVASAGFHTWEFRLTNVVGGIICSDTGNFNVPLDYDALPLNVSVLSQTNVGCTGTGSVTVLLTAWDIPSGVYVDLFNQTNLVTPVQSVFVYTNNYTFSSLAPGNYVIRLYRQFPPGNPQFGQKSTCYSEIQVAITQTCILKATDCLQPTVIRYFDGTAYTALIGTVIDALINGKQACWIIEESSGTIDALLGTYLGPYATCPECKGEPCTDILSSVSIVDDICDQAIGSVTVTPLTGTGPYTYSWDTSPAQTTQTATDLTAGTYTVLITDVLGCTGTATVIVNNTCIKNYLIVPCDTTLDSFIITNPITSPNSDPDTYVGFFQGSILLPSGTELEGCFQMVSYFASGLTGVVITVTATYSSCIECLPPVCYKLTRCDDNAISFIVSNDLSAELDQVIDNVVLDCNTLPCRHILPEQCWMVSQAPDCTGAVVLLSYGELLPNCSCCKTCPL